ncbi:MAG: DUF4365 domain-containing protein [Sphingomonas sp.]|nr:DUF4365 domain-containing protein [Sphingomonas sp.]
MPDKTKQRVQQHLVDQDGIQMLRTKLPRQWVLREYRPDYGLDFALEVFGDGISGESSGYETLGEHLFIQLKTVAKGQAKPLKVYSRGNVEKGPEKLNRKDKVGALDTYRCSLEMSELVTVERMGIGVPVLLVIADLAADRCSFVCLNDYIDKLLVPGHKDYRAAGHRTIHVPVANEIGSTRGLVGLRWYAKRAKLLAAFQRFVFQYAELQYAEDGDWRNLACYFGERISGYDFWDDTEMCAPIAYHAARLRRFLAEGQPGYFELPSETPEGVDPKLFANHIRKSDVFELWRLLALLPRTYEDVWREWFLPTSLGLLTSD